MISQVPVVEAQEMSRIERLAIAEGCDEASFMERAGVSIADCTEKFVQQQHREKVVTLLIGKGNNGGDAFTAGMYLQDRGYRVKALTLYPKEICSSLCRKQWDRFLAKQGEVVQVDLQEKFPFMEGGIILDGLVGTGFRGKAEGELAEAIRQANRSGLPIVAVDIPSGVSGDSGQVGSIAIQAAATIYLEFPKMGFFLEQGYDHIGQILRGTFDLPKAYQELAEPKAFLLDGEGLGSLVKKGHRSEHKYEAGYVLVVAGSPSMAGAGILSAYAALKSGAGIVRLFHSKGMEPLLSAAPVEILKTALGEDVREFLQEETRAKACVIGPGLGRDLEAQKKIGQLLSSLSIPVVIDADALWYLAETPEQKIPSRSVLTPHRGEMKRLVQGDFLSASQRFVEEKKTIVLVKGAPNYLFSPGKKPCILPFGNPGMATAGSGDVLTGIIAANIAAGLELFEATILGCYIHGLSGDLAVQEKTEFCLVASDLIDYLPKAFKQILF